MGLEKVGIARKSGQDERTVYVTFGDKKAQPLEKVVSMRSPSFAVVSLPEFPLLLPRILVLVHVF